MKKLRATIDPLQEKGKINRELYGQFIEQAGRIVYGGWNTSPLTAILK